MTAEPLYRPLAGLRVVEAGGEVATRYCGRLYARLGRSVVQVGDRTNDPVSHPGAAGRAFAAWLDEGKTTAPDLAAALASLKGVEDKSLVIGGQTPEAVRALDLALSRSSEAIVRVGLTWFGAVGAYAGWRGHDAVILALSGIAYGFGLPEGPPDPGPGARLPDPGWPQRLHRRPRGADGRRRRPRPASTSTCLNPPSA